MHRLKAGIVLFLSVGLSNCVSRAAAQTAAPAVAYEDLKALASAVAAEVAAVKAVSLGERGAPILVLEERHDSPVAQLQEALMLVRLHDHHHLRQICLEGFTKEQAPSDFPMQWQAAAGAGGARFRVAVRLVKEGEISSAEFMRLTFDDIELVPAEVRAQYEVQAPASSGVDAYLAAIALHALTPEAQAELDRMAEESRQLPAGPAKTAKRRELTKLLLAADPWVKQQLDARRKRVLSEASIEEEIAFLDAIVEHARAANAPVDKNAVKAMEQEIAVLKARGSASETMVRSAVAAADRPGVAVVAMIIGAGHTARVSELLAGMRRPFAVLRPRAVDATYRSTDLTEQMFERKREGRSVFGDTLAKMIREAYDGAHRTHPQPVLDEAWFQAKAESFLFLDEIARGVLGPEAAPSTPKTHAGGGSIGPPPTLPPVAPFGFGDDSFKGKRAHVDPKTIRTMREGRRVVAIFPLVLNYNSNLATTIWVKVGLSRDEGVPKAENMTAEALLRSALREAAREESALKQRPKNEQEDDTRADRPEADERGRVKVSADVVAVFAHTEAEVEKARVYRG